MRILLLLCNARKHILCGDDIMVEIGGIRHHHVYMPTHSGVKPMEAGKWHTTQVKSVVVILNRVGHFSVNTCVIGVGADPCVSAEKVRLSSLRNLPSLHGCGSARENHPV